MNIDERLIVCCGLDCENCDARIATLNNDNQLREKTAKEWSDMNNAPQITPETINCEGCRIDGIHFAFCNDYCVIRKCVIEKNFNTCAQCNDMNTCNKLYPIVNNNPSAKRNLEHLKD
ncbi:MAG: DUF3795 domain-containing protein [Bacteroidales bacterium]|nr:DUF3795 domain-containing protein [Bacteroidales bacterium]